MFYCIYGGFHLPKTRVSFLKIGKNLEGILPEVEKVEKMGIRLESSLKALKAKYPDLVHEVRGKGSGIAGETSVSVRTSSGRRAATFSATTPPRELPSRCTGWSSSCSVAAK